MAHDSKVNNSAWEKLFNKYDILKHIEEDGCFNISAEKIKEFREPRLMAKFDHAVNLPEIFQVHKLAILPVRRGGYVIAHFQAYYTLPKLNDPPVVKIDPPSIQSICSSNIYSETIAINYAFAAGILADFLEDKELVPTVSGRMGSGHFCFRIDDQNSDKLHEIVVDNSQIEIDAAFEGIKSLALFEAKCDLSDDFLVRQLYYPYRTWQKRVNKPVRPVFLVYSNGIYRLYEYEFKELEKYNSLFLSRQKHYSVEDTRITTCDIQTVLDTVRLCNEPEIPFPQADSFERVINLCELLRGHSATRTDVTARYAFNSRQTNYYTDAARYLGLLQKKTEKKEPTYYLTESGKCLLALTYRERQLKYCEIILAHRPFNFVLREYLKNGVMPTNKEILQIMKDSHLHKLDSDETYIRRSSTVKSWVNWIVSLLNDCQ